MLIDMKNIIRAFKQEAWKDGISVSNELWPKLFEWIQEHILSDFLTQVTKQVDELVDIDPDLSEREIFERATRYMVGFLDAHSASVRIYDPQTEQMLSYGSFPYKEDERENVIPLDGSIAGEVVKSLKPITVPDILEDQRYQNKDIIYRKGVSSLMAIPLDIPRFYPRERDTAGVIQIYYLEKGRTFTNLEIQVANLMAKRLSFVIARKKILSMHKSNEKKELIIQHIFRTLGKRGGIKMEEVFNRLIPDLADIVNLQSCALFSISNNLENIVLEAGYPVSEGSYHNIGVRFSVKSEPVFEILLNLMDYTGDSIYEIVSQSYLLIVDPQRTELISENLKHFAALYNINSILYIPLYMNGEITHFMTFDALDQRQRYRDDEIDVFLFLGHELIKAQKMERLDDALHDFKNPAIAIAGFARRLMKLLDQDICDESRAQIMKYAGILMAETSRIQELSMSLYKVGEVQKTNLTDILKKRFEINKEAIREQLRQDIFLKEGPFVSDLFICCHVIHLERLFDNLLNNATKAIPIRGGHLAISTFIDEGFACARISNTGQISKEARTKILEGDGPGRGFYITHRIIRQLKGEIKIDSDKTSTSILVKIPLCHDV